MINLSVLLMRNNPETVEPLELAVGTFSMWNVNWKTHFFQTST